MSRRRRQQWCYWLSIGAIILVVCLHWMRRNADTVARVHARHENVRRVQRIHDEWADPNTILEPQMPKLRLGKGESSHDALLHDKKVVPRTERNAYSHSKLSETRPLSTSDPRSKIGRDHDNREALINPDKSSQKKLKKVVILMTQLKSGSSLIEEYFAMGNTTMVLDEPLFPYGLNCSSRGEHKVTLLGQLLSCNFTNLQSLYAAGFNLSRVEDDAKCVKNGLCYAGKELLQGYTKICSRIQKNASASSDHSISSACGFPLRETILQEQCRNAKVIFAKVTRICTIDQLQVVYDILTKKGIEPYIIHLVRDPRSMIFSQTKSNGVESKTICSRMRKNLNITNKHFSGGRYKRVRFEDLVGDKVGWAKKLYRFIGDSVIPVEVEKFLVGKISENKKLSMNEKPYTPVDVPQEAPNEKLSSSDELLQKWRTDISFEMMSAVQKHCGDVMKAFRYMSFKTNKELRNTSLPFFM